MALAGVGALVGENPPGLVDVGDAGDGSSGSAAFARAAAASEDAGDLWVAPPAWATWHARVYKADVTGDGVPDGVLVGGGRFELWAAGGEGTEPVFSSPDEWLVSDGRVADLDGDGLPEVVLLVWRAANFGSSRPFWVEEPEDGEEFTQHIFVLGWQGGELRPRWMSSQTGVEIAAMDVDAGGALVLTDRRGVQTRWRWGSWGFALEDDSAAAAEGAATPVERATVLAAGDVIGHEALLAAARDGEGGFDFGPLFAPVVGLVAEADLAVVGQETPFVSDPALYGGYPYFGTPCALGDALAEVGFDVVLGASNHMLDRGERGLADTLAFWEGRPDVELLGVRQVPGAGGNAAVGGEGDDGEGDGPFGPTVVEVRGFRLALFDATYGTNGRTLPEGSAYEVASLGAEALGAAVPEAGEQDASLASARLERLAAQVEAARACDDVDLVACFLHIGQEYGDAPSQAERAVVQRLADAGADAVLCSHGHEALGWERLACSDGRTCAVAWGLGNFAAVQDDLACMLGVCARLVLERGGDGEARVADVELVPTVMHLGRDGGAGVYPLADYTDGLAADHVLNDRGRPVTVAGLWELYLRRTGGDDGR